MVLIMSGQTLKYPDLGKPTWKDRGAAIAASRYFVGTTVESLVDGTKKLNVERFGVIADLVGESKDCEKKQLRADRIRIIGDIILSEELEAAIALRPGQFGYDYKLLREVADELAKKGIFVWIDIEKRDTVDLTISAYLDIVGENPGRVGLALQAYLNRTMRDIDRLIAFTICNGIEIHIRPVRGVYVGEADMGMLEMHENLTRMMDVLATCGNANVIQHPASHHPLQIAHGIKLNKQYGNVVRSIQLLMGVFRRIPGMIRDAGTPTEIYMPYGPELEAYLRRRNEEAGGTMRGLLLAGFNERRNIRTLRETGALDRQFEVTMFTDGHPKTGSLVMTPDDKGRVIMNIDMPGSMNMRITPSGKVVRQ